MRIDEAIEYITSATWSQWRLGLERTYELLERVGSPDKQLKFVHVAGTNGKGSTCAMVESMLRAAGYTTGIYPSPYIEDFRERIQVNAEPIPEEALCELTELVKAEAEKMEDHPSQFEIITAIGMLWFARNDCDIVVLEVGLGGAFDSTNIIDPPEVAVITNIGLDHTEYLGATLEEIARTKCGIIKSGSDVVAYPNVKEVTDVIDAACDEKGCRLRYADFARIEPLTADLTGRSFRWNKEKSEPMQGDGQIERLLSRGDLENNKDHTQQKCPSASAPGGTIATRCGLIIKMPLVGEYQLRNAAVALTVIEAMRERGWNISDDSIVEGMAKVSWPARFEVLGQDPVFILDGGHNRQCAEAVAESLKEFFPGGGLTLLIGVLADKDYESILDLLLPFAEKCFCVTPDSDRALPAEKLASIINEKKKSQARATAASDRYPAAFAEATAFGSTEVTEESHPKAIAFDSIEAAVGEALKGSAPVIAFGSLYMAGKVRRAYRGIRQ